MNTGNVHIGRASARELLAYSVVKETFGREKIASVLERISANYKGMSSEATVGDSMGSFYAFLDRAVPENAGRTEVSQLCITVSPNSSMTVAGVVIRSDPRLLGRDAAIYARQCCEELLRELRGN
ncbi:hypothetical protein KY359_03220 [Candidatus Woesearchaeota archaeon]|nr:hypothetical protein [Candidatus Woesearchaeota archaeon]